jgi:cytochrome P450
LTRCRSYIPEYTNVRIHFWSVHRDPRNFSHPDTFFPDRWLIADGLQAAPEPLVHNPSAFVPFSFGPWNCVGKNLALLELRCVTVHIVQRLSLRFQDGYDPAEWDRNIGDNFLIKTGKLPIIAERRF